MDCPKCKGVYTVSIRDGGDWDMVAECSSCRAKWTSATWPRTVSVEDGGTEIVIHFAELK